MFTKKSIEAVIDAGATDAWIDDDGDLIAVIRKPSRNIDSGEFDGVTLPYKVVIRPRDGKYYRCGVIDPCNTPKNLIRGGRPVYFFRSPRDAVRCAIENAFFY